VDLNPDLERTLRQYVLGGLEEERRGELEGRLITEPVVFEALGVIEDELIEDYLDGTGSVAERRSFEQRFLASGEGQRRLRLARALRHRAAALTSRPRAEASPARRGWPTAWTEWLEDWLRPPRLQPAWAALAALLVLSLAANVWLASRPGTGLGRPAGPATFALASGLLRGEGALPRVAVPPGGEIVRLHLELPEDEHALYRATLHDPDGAEIWSASRLRAVGRPAAVVLVVPAELLPRGDCRVALSGMDDRGEPELLATYPFRVVAP
jgi:hypothetical protein